MTMTEILNDYNKFLQEQIRNYFRFLKEHIK